MPKGTAEDRTRHTVDERVQDGHGTVGDTSVRVNLLEDWRNGVSDASLRCERKREESRSRRRVNIPL